MLGIERWWVHTQGFLQSVQLKHDECKSVHCIGKSWSTHFDCAFLQIGTKTINSTTPTDNVFEFWACTFLEQHSQQLHWWRTPENKNLATWMNQLQLSQVWSTEDHTTKHQCCHSLRKNLWGFTWHKCGQCEDCKMKHNSLLWNHVGSVSTTDWPPRDKHTSQNKPSAVTLTQNQSSRFHHWTISMVNSLESVWNHLNQEWTTAHLGWHVTMVVALTHRIDHEPNQEFFIIIFRHAHN